MPSAELIKRAMKKAKKSNCRYKVAAIGFTKKGDFFGICYNRGMFIGEGGSLHAEVNLMNKFGRKIKTIVICRVGKNELRPIDPCEKCLKRAKELGIKIQTIK